MHGTSQIILKAITRNLDIKCLFMESLTDYCTTDESVIYLGTQSLPMTTDVMNCFVSSWQTVLYSTHKECISLIKLKVNRALFSTHRKKVLISLSRPLDLKVDRPLNLKRMASVMPDLQLPSQLQSNTDSWSVPNYTAWWQKQKGVNNLPRVTTW